MPDITKTDLQQAIFEATYALMCAMPDIVSAIATNTPAPALQWITENKTAADKNGTHSPYSRSIYLAMHQAITDSWGHEIEQIGEPPRR